jgi:glycosyltransferase involved in cell wall biosynthesis
MAALRIGVNTLYLIPGGVGGTEIYLRSLLEALAELDSRNEYFVYTNRETGRDLVPKRPNFHWRPQAVRAIFRPGRILWEQTLLPLAAATAGLDVLLNPGFTAPICCPCPQVTVFHDLQHKNHPEYFRWFDLPFWRVLLYLAAQTSTLVLAISERTRADLLRYYRLPEAKVRMVPLGVDAHLFGVARRPEPFLLCVSTLHPHKNLDGLLRAFAEFHKARPDFRLVMTGLKGFATGALEELRARLGLEAAVEFTGWIERERVRDLYARAYGVVYPSLFEGFGLPILEALAAGAPTACSAIEPLKTLAGGAALEFDPRDPAAIAAAMLRLVSDDALRDRLSAAGPAQAARYSWKATAAGTLAALEAAAGAASSLP